MPLSRRVLTLAVENAQSLDVLGPVDVFDSANSLTSQGAYSVEVVTPDDAGRVSLSNRPVLEAKPLPDRLHDTTRVEHGHHAARCPLRLMPAR